MPKNKRKPLNLPKVEHTYVDDGGEVQKVPTHTDEELAEREDSEEDSDE